MNTHNISLLYRRSKTSLNCIHLLPDPALGLTLSGSNYLCRTIFHGLKDVRAIEDLLYVNIFMSLIVYVPYICFEMLPGRLSPVCKSCPLFKIYSSVPIYLKSARFVNSLSLFSSMYSKTCNLRGISSGGRKYFFKEWLLEQRTHSKLKITEMASFLGQTSYIRPIRPHQR